MMGSRSSTGSASLPSPTILDRSRESGYAYLLALFLVMAMIIGSQAVLENLATQGRRMREQQMIWRGEQWERAIRLYYHKTGKYPQSTDDLETGMAELHFLRIEAYKDPMNQDDGSWRLIYVNASGQISCSTKYATLQQMALLDLNNGKIPLGATLPGAVPVSSVASASSTQFGMFGQSPFSSSSVTTQTAGPQTATPQSAQAGQQPSQQSGQQSSQQSDQQPSPSDSNGQPVNPLALLKPTGPCDGPVIGGFLTGVASKVESPSVKIYKGGKKYINWEFIWNPLEDQARAMQAGLTSQGALPPGFGAAATTGAAGQPSSSGTSGPTAAPSPAPGPAAGETPQPLSPNGP